MTGVSAPTRPVAATRRSKKILAEKITPDQVIAEVKNRASRSWRRRFPDRTQVGSCCGSFRGRNTSSAIPTKVNLGRSRIAISSAITPHGDRGDGHCRLRHGHTVGYNYIHGEIFRIYEQFEEALDEARAAGSLATTSSAPALTSSCTPSTAMGRISAAKRPPCSNLSRARRVSLVSSRHFRRASACTANQRRSTPRPLLRYPWIIRKGRRFRLPQSRFTQQRRHQTVLGFWRRRASGNFEIPLGTPFSKLLELAGGIRGGKKSKP